MSFGPFLESLLKGILIHEVSKPWVRLFYLTLQIPKSSLNHINKQRKLGEKSQPLLSSEGSRLPFRKVQLPQSTLSPESVDSSSRGVSCPCEQKPQIKERPLAQIIRILLGKADYKCSLQC